jgi:hypothetical protein
MRAVSLSHPRLTNRLVAQVCRSRLPHDDHVALRRSCGQVFDGVSSTYSFLHDRLRLDTDFLAHNVNVKHAPTPPLPHTLTTHHKCLPCVAPERYMTGLCSRCPGTQAPSEEGAALSSCPVVRHHAPIMMIGALGAVLIGEGLGVC